MYVSGGLAQAGKPLRPVSARFRGADETLTATECRRELADKPGSVVEQSFIWDARCRAPRATYPGTVRTTPVFPYLVLLRTGFTLPCLLPAMRCALTAPFHPYPTAREQSGGIFSVALSVGSRPPGVTWRPVLWSPDFPPRPGMDTRSERLPGQLPDLIYQIRCGGCDRHNPGAGTPQYSMLCTDRRSGERRIHRPMMRLSR